MAGMNKSMCIRSTVVPDCISVLRDPNGSEKPGNCFMTLDIVAAGFMMAYDEVEYPVNSRKAGTRIASPGLAVQTCITILIMGPGGMLGTAGPSIEKTSSRSSASTPWMTAVRPVKLAAVVIASHRRHGLAAPGR